MIESEGSQSKDVTWPEVQKQWDEKCDTEEVEFDATKWGGCPNNKMKILVHKPKTLDSEKEYKTIFWCHGGAFFMFTAKNL